MNTLRVIINTANTEPETLECGCVFTPNQGLVHFRYCHLHLAAADLLAALEFALPFCPMPRGDGAFSRAYANAYVAAHAAIARAKETT